MSPKTQTGQEQPPAANMPLGRNSYLHLGFLLFLAMILSCWRGYLRTHEIIYLLGPRRVDDPEFLANDLTWSKLPPTSFLFDHLVAPFLGFLDLFAVANLGRFLTWSLTAWALALLARSLRLPPWTVLVGYLLWLGYGQTLGSCGPHFEGFQVKSLCYPLIFFALHFVIRKRVALAGLLLGLATAFHIIVGGWACLAIFLAMVAHRKSFSLGRLALFLVATAPFILPLLVAVVTDHVGHASGEQSALMNRIYVLFRMPHCCDPDYFLTLRRWFRALPVFILCPILIYRVTGKHEANILAGFLIALLGIFVFGMIARWLDLFWFLKLYPHQLSLTFPLLFFFIFALAYLSRLRLAQKADRITSIAVLALTVWLVDERDALKKTVDLPVQFVNEWQEYRQRGSQAYGDPVFFAWIRENTPKDAIFITPTSKEFWFYGERSQVVSFRHPPLDTRLIEWRERLDELNGFEPFENTGFKTETEYDFNQANLPLPHLIYLRNQHGANYYLTRFSREDLEDRLLISSSTEDNDYFLYDLEGLTL